MQTSCSTPTRRHVTWPGCSCWLLSILKFAPCGTNEMRMGQTESAAASWRRCLELSDRYLDRIVPRAAALLGPNDLVEKLLPDQPELLFRVAYRLYPQAEADAARAPFLRKALLLVNAEATALEHQGLAHQGAPPAISGTIGRGSASYRALLAREPLQVGWRYELASLFYGGGSIAGGTHGNYRRFWPSSAGHARGTRTRDQWP